jgi:hypothetical protein
MRKMILAGLLAGLLFQSAAALAAGGLATIPVGDLVLWFDGDIWRVERQGQSYEIHAIGAGPGDAPISLTVTGDGSKPCSPEAVLDLAKLLYSGAWMHGVRTVPRPGFDLQVATLDMGCRNLTGSPVFACTAYQGKDYFLTAVPGGCRETPPNYDGPVLDLLMGLSLP